jgi:hypothetical protein
MTQYWFRKKKDGGLWRPCTWQGWVCVMLAIGSGVVDFIRLDARSHSVSDTIRPWLLQMVILGGAFLLVAWLKSERPGTLPQKGD